MVVSRSLSTFPITALAFLLRYQHLVPTATTKMVTPITNSTPSRPPMMPYANAGSEVPAEPGGEVPAEPGGEVPAEPGREVPAEPGGEVPAEPGGEAPAERIRGCMTNSTPTHRHPSYHPVAEPGSSGTSKVKVRVEGSVRLPSSLPNMAHTCRCMKHQLVDPAPQSGPATHGEVVVVGSVGRDAECVAHHLARVGGVGLHGDKAPDKAQNQVHTQRFRPQWLLQTHIHLPLPLPPSLSTHLKSLPVQVFHARAADADLVLVHRVAQGARRLPLKLSLHLLPGERAPHHRDVVHWEGGGVRRYSVWGGRGVGEHRLLHIGLTGSRLRSLVAVWEETLNKRL